MAIKLASAQEVLLQAVAIMPQTEEQLEECYQRVLAETVRAETDFPPFDRSPLDGYAVIADEVQAASAQQPVRLTVIDNIPAGSMPQRMLTPGTAARIMTGAPVPTGATGVVRLEDTHSEGQQVNILDGSGIAGNICRRGEEIIAGETVVGAGAVINVGVMGMLALLGKGRPLVYKKPRVAILATGSEVVAIDAPLAAGAIRNSNSYMIGAQVAEAGADRVLLGIAPDCQEQIACLVESAAACDLIISTGGVSVGDYDLMKHVYKQLGITVLFERVEIKPGMPVLAGSKADKLYIGLSGNPAAASIAFELLVRPVLLKMAGQNNWFRPRVKAVLLNEFAKGSGPLRFVWAHCWQLGSKLVVQPLALQANGMLKSAMAANSLLVIPPNCPPLPASSEVEVILLGALGGDCAP